MPATTSNSEYGRREESIGLALAIAVHLGLAGFLLWRPAGKALVTPPERMTVTLSEELAPTSTSPEPNAQAAPDAAPEIGEAAPAPEPQPVAKAEPEALPPPPVPKPVAKPQPRPEPHPIPKPASRAVQRPAPAARPSPRAAPRPAQPAPRAAAQPRATSNAAAARPAQRPSNRPAGASNFADAFKDGVPGAAVKAGASQNAPAAAIGPDVKASISGAISRQLKPHWTAPQGMEADLLVTRVRFRLAQDGTLIGQPEVVSQTGVTAANAAQKARHAEQAIRAVRLAAPFQLPDQYYSVWKSVTTTFDRRLSQ